MAAVGIYIAVDLAFYSRAIHSFLYFALAICSACNETIICRGDFHGLLKDVLLLAENLINSCLICDITF